MVDPTCNSLISNILILCVRVCLLANYIIQLGERFSKCMERGFRNKRKGKIKQMNRNGIGIGLMV